MRCLYGKSRLRESSLFDITVKSIQLGPVDGMGGGKGSPSYPSATGIVQSSALRITHGFIQKDTMQDISDTCLALSSSLINSDSFLENRLARS